MKYFALLAVLVLALACGSKNVAPTFDGESNGGSFSTNAGTGGQRSFGSSGSGGSGGATGGEAGAADAGDSAEAPTVEITSPEAVADPTVGMVLTADAVTVTCSVTASKVSGFALHAGDLVTIETSGGGGFGDPRRRDPARVARDVGEGLVTAEQAAAIYGTGEEVAA